MSNATSSPRPTQKLGIMQGRLSPRPTARLQAFPHATWQKEFFLAREIGFDGIEWIYEAERASENPLVSPDGRRLIRETATESGTPVLSVCGDYFMVHRLSEPGTVGVRAAEALIEVIAWTKEIGAKRILLPWLEEAALDTEEKLVAATTNLRTALPAAARLDIVLGLEMEIPGPEYRAVIERIGHPQVGAYYDTGNSTAQGADVEDDIRPLLPHLRAVHLKDRVVGGSSRPLGKGDTNFAGLFRTLKASGFSGDFVSQHYFEVPEVDAKDTHSFLRKLIPKEPTP